MDFLAQILDKAKQNPRRIVLPETHDERIIEATHKIISAKIAHVILVGDRNLLAPIFTNADKNFLTIHDPNLDNQLADSCINSYFERRKAKGLSLEEARQVVLSKKHFFGALLVEQGLADGMVCGADCTTAETLRALIHCVGTRPGSKLISSFFVMITKHEEIGKDGIVFFADCAVNPCPDAEQLASIAIDTADSFKQIMAEEPKVAMLSFSTKGSAEHPLVDKVRSALESAKTQRPSLLIDGEFQFDASVIPKIGQKKAPGSAIAGHSNCLIFPDLQSGNIGYKIAERLGDAVAVGPIIQGAKKPINDLSRGCSVDDIFYVTAVTGLQA